MNGISALSEIFLRKNKKIIRKALTTLNGTSDLRGLFSCKKTGKQQ
jgi:hypothetical protein